MSGVTPAPSEVTFTLEVGRLLRGQIRRELKASAIREGVKLDIQEDKGFFESLFICRVRGPVAADYALAIQRWIASLS